MKRPATESSVQAGYRAPAWPPTRTQLAAGAVGLAIGIASIGDGPPVAAALRLAGYPVACAAIARWVPIVRQRRVGWLVAHELAMGGICAGWALVPGWGGVAVNGAWGAVALAWWTLGARRSRKWSGPRSEPLH
ncbi:MAG: hypothetical protein ACYDAD_00705 [Acidimicrobiales bacterium]